MLHIRRRCGTGEGSPITFMALYGMIWGRTFSYRLTDFERRMLSCTETIYSSISINSPLRSSIAKLDLDSAKNISWITIICESVDRLAALHKSFGSCRDNMTQVASIWYRNIEPPLDAQCKLIKAIPLIQSKIWVFIIHINISINCESRRMSHTFLLSLLAEIGFLQEGSADESPGTPS